MSRRPTYLELAPVKFFLKLGALATLCFFVMVLVASVTPRDFPLGPVDIHVARDSSISSVATKLYKERIISSPFLFKVAATIFSSSHGIWVGDYRFEKRQTVWTVAHRMVTGAQGLPHIKIVIPEGTNVYDMAYIYMTKLTNFNAPQFLALALPYEGYLFPDTYSFLSNTKPEEVIKKMRATFTEKIAPWEKDIEKFGKPLRDVIIMASIVEKEAKRDESRRVVAGILWNRLKDGMKLQVDAPFYYLTGKRGGFTFDDLKIDSAYNTYLYKGLPIAPISNPGLDAIRDTIDPIETDYVYYLTGHDGEMYYAETFDGHIENRNTYLK